MAAYSEGSATFLIAPMMHANAGTNMAQQLLQIRQQQQEQQQVSRFAARGPQQQQQHSMAAASDGPATVALADNSDSSDHIIEVVGYSSNTTTNGFGQVNGFEFLFNGGG